MTSAACKRPIRFSADASNDATTRSSSAGVGGPPVAANACRMAWCTARSAGPVGVARPRRILNAADAGTSVGRPQHSSGPLPTPVRAWASASVVTPRTRRSSATDGAPSTRPSSPRYSRQDTLGARPGSANGSAPSTSRVGDPVMPTAAATSGFSTTRWVNSTSDRLPASASSSRRSNSATFGQSGTCRISSLIATPLDRCAGRATAGIADRPAEDHSWRPTRRENHASAADR